MEGTILSSKSTFEDSPDQQPQVHTKARKIHTGSAGLGHFPLPVVAWQVLMSIISQCIIFPIHYTQKVGTKLSSEPLFTLCPKLLHSHALLFGIRLHQISAAHFLAGTASEVAEVLSTRCSVSGIKILKPKVYLHVTAFPLCSSLTTEEGDSELWNPLPQTTTEIPCFNPILRLVFH